MLDDASLMRRALALAARGAGHVEPNPMVGCVIARDGAVVGEGWHRRFGGPHAEVEALRAAGSAAAGATLYVTLEPCCHHGKTPPCSEAVIAAGLRRVVIGMRDPFPRVDGGGIRQLEAAGIETAVGLLQDEAGELNAPYLKLLAEGRPWVIAKWAMTLDGKIATRTGDSQWISNEAARAVVHQLRGRVDGIMVGRGTALADNPRLTARPAGARRATRVVCDSQAQLPLASQLVRSAAESPVLVAVGPNAPVERCSQLRSAGCEVLSLSARNNVERLRELLLELGRRRWTNLLVEGGGGLLGALFDGQLIDEVHAFIAPKLVGGSGPSVVGGFGVETIGQAARLFPFDVEQLEDNVYLHGRVSTRMP